MPLYHAVSRKFIFFFFALFFVIFLLNQLYSASPDGNDEQKITPTPSPMFPATSMPDRDWWQALWPNPKDVLRAIDVTSNMVVLDLCCGDGYFTIPLAEMAAKVYGLELDGVLLEQAKRDAAVLNIQHCHWIQGDAMQIANSIPEFVDYVLIANTFHGIPNKQELVKSVASVLKPGGQFTIVNWHQRSREETTVLGLPRGPKTEMRMSPEQVNDIVLPLGFDLKSITDVSPYHYAAVFIKHRNKRNLD